MKFSVYLTLVLGAMVGALISGIWNFLDAINSMSSRNAGTTTDTQEYTVYIGDLAFRHLVMQPLSYIMVATVAIGAVLLVMLIIKLAINNKSSTSATH